MRGTGSKAGDGLNGDVARRSASGIDKAPEVEFAINFASISFSCD